MKKFLFGVVVCMAAGALGMQKSAKPKRSIKWNLSPYAVQQQHDVLGKLWVMKACEDRCWRGKGAIHQVSKHLNGARMFMDLYKKDMEEAGMTRRHIYKKITGIQSKFYDLIDRVEKEQAYMQRFSEKNADQLAKYQARQKLNQKKD